MRVIAVTGIYRYPVKSCGGMALEEAAIGRRGIEHDREFMVVDDAGFFLTQRELPRLALIRSVLAEGLLRLEGPGMRPLDLRTVCEGEPRDVVVWRDRCPAIDQGAEAARWLGQFLGVACRLVRMAEGYARRVDPAYAVSEKDEVGFADGYPFLLISEESLADLNGRMAAPLAINRFRPNIVVAGGGAPYLEDGWRRIRIGDVTFALVKACARCVTTTTDQETAERGREPLATLATYRRVERGVLFGQNLIHEGVGAIRCGQRVEVVD